MHALRPVALAGALLVELAAVVALGYAGFAGPGPLAVRIVLGLGYVAAFVAVWGRFMAPRAARRLGMPAYRYAKLAIFAMAAVLLAISGAVLATVVFAAAAVVDELLLLAMPAGRSDSQR